MSPDQTAAGFARLDDWLGKATASLAPGARKLLLRELIREMRGRNQKRMTRQTGPGGEKWAPRKPRQGRPIQARAKMLLGFRKARRMVVTGNADQAETGYRGRTAQLAAVHHLGLVDEVVPGGPSIRYPARPLLGFAPADIAWIRSRILDHLAESID